MKFSPSIEEVKAIAATGEYMVLPVSCEILSDICTPIETMKILKNVSTHCYMLESVAEKEKWGRYTFLGFDPKLEITCVDGELKAGDTLLRTEHPSEFLRRILAEYKSPRFDYLPSFTGGLVGYFSYDYLGYSEPAVRTKVQDTENFKDVDLMLFDKVIAFDNFRQKIILIAKEAKGFLYIVSSLGVTGTRSEIKTDLASIVKVVREHTDIPCAIGFGISTPEQARKMADISDGAIVGSAIIKLLEKYGKDAPKYVGEYVASMKEAMR